MTDLDAIRARRTAAGDKKWWWQSEPCYQLACDEAEAAFISAARADIDALLTEVEALRNPSPFDTPPGMEGGRWVREHSDGVEWFDEPYGPSLSVQRVAWHGPDQPFDWDEYQRDQREGEQADMAAEMQQMDD